MKQIDIENWNRKEHYHFFSKKQSPYLGITANVKCTKACIEAKEFGRSLFAHYLHCSLTVANNIPEFKYRIIDDMVFELEKINAGATVSREDHTFAFIFAEYDADFDVFNKKLKKEIEEVKNSTGLRLNNDDIKLDLIRYTTLPWVKFTSLLHPTNFDNNDSVPRISFGKIFEKQGGKYLPVSVEAHHGLMDGYHIARYFEEFENLLSVRHKPE